MKNLYILFLILLIACSAETKETETAGESEKKIIPVVAINDRLSSRALKLSEIADVERIVRIETRKDVLIPDYFAPFATDKYIIILDAKQIRQFSLDGKFIRVLSLAGKGPREYWALTGITLDTHNELLYFTHVGDKKHIQVIDLNTGTWLERIKFPDEFLALPELAWVSNLILMNDSTFVCVPKMFPENTISFFSMSTKGKFLGSFHNHERFMQIPLNAPVPFCNVVEHKIHYMGPEVDTLFEIRNNQKIPVCYFDIADRLTEERMEGYRRYFSVERNTYALLYTIDTKLKRTEDGTLSFSFSRLDVYKPDYYFIDYKTFKSFLLSGSEIDFLGFKQERLMPLKILNENFICYFDAGTFKSNARQVLKENTASPEILKRVKELDAQITENDNPILIIGKLK